MPYNKKNCDMGFTVFPRPYTLRPIKYRRMDESKGNMLDFVRGILSPLLI